VIIHHGGTEKIGEDLKLSVGAVFVNAMFDHHGFLNIAAKAMVEMMR